MQQTIQTVGEATGAWPPQAPLKSLCNMKWRDWQP